jgi:DNA-binding IclR family transcriptional regulator
MREITPSLNSPARTLAVLEQIIADGGRSSVSAIARTIGIPVSAAHRHVNALLAAGYLARSAYGRHVAGPALRRIAGMIDEKQIVANAAAVILDRLASRTKCVCQLGTLENDMVTYRLKTGRSADNLFTRVGMQLEAYCSAIGKVLLANLNADERAAYLANGPFIALTDRTITDPEALERELARARREGFAVDDEEVVAGLRCVAVPVRNPSGEVIAAISASQAADRQGPMPPSRLLAALKDAAREIEHRMIPNEAAGAAG